MNTFILLGLFLLPTVTLGVVCALDLFCRHDEDAPMTRTIEVQSRWQSNT
jgi:hypothetical protein